MKKKVAEIAINRLIGGETADCKASVFRLRLSWPPIVTKLLFDDSSEVHANGGHGKILGGGMAAEVAHSSCTDLPPRKK